MNILKFKTPDNKISSFSNSKNSILLTQKNKILLTRKTIKRKENLLTKMSEKQIPLYSKKEGKVLYDKILIEVLCGKNLPKNLELFLSIVSSRYGFKLNYMIEDLGETWASCLPEKNLINFNLDFFQVETLGEFASKLETIEHEFAHIKDFTENGLYRINRDNFGRCTEGTLKDYLSLLVDSVQVIPDKIALKTFAVSMYAVSAEEVIAREKGVFYLTNFLLDLKQKAQEIDENKYIDFIKNCENICEESRNFEKNLMKKHMQIVKENKEEVKKIYKNIIQEQIESDDYNKETLTYLCAMQDSYYFYDKRSYKQLMDFAKEKNDKPLQLNLLNSKYGERDVGKFNAILNEFLEENPEAIGIIDADILCNFDLKDKQIQMKKSAIETKKPEITPEKN